MRKIDSHKVCYPHSGEKIERPRASERCLRIPEVLRDVLLRSEPKDVRALRLVNRCFYGAAQTPVVWRHEHRADQVSYPMRTIFKWVPKVPEDHLISNLPSRHSQPASFSHKLGSYRGEDWTLAAGSEPHKPLNKDLDAILDRIIAILPNERAWPFAPEDDSINYDNEDGMRRAAFRFVLDRNYRLDNNLGPTLLANQTSEVKLGLFLSAVSFVGLFAVYLYDRLYRPTNEGVRDGSPSLSTIYLAVFCMPPLLFAALLLEHHDENALAWKNVFSSGQIEREVNDLAREAQRYYRPS